MVHFTNNVAVRDSPDAVTVRSPLPKRRRRIATSGQIALQIRLVDAVPPGLSITQPGKQPAPAHR